MTQETVVVMGATGRMGQDIVIRLIKSGKYQVRALTRNADGKSAKALSELVSKQCSEHPGRLQLQSCDPKDAASLKSAFEGAEYIWAMTTNDFGTREVEYNASMQLARIAQDSSSLKYLLYSTLPNTLEISNGKYDVGHCTEKARAFAEMCKMDLPVIGISPGNFATNVFKEEHGGFFSLKKDGDKFIMSLPMDGDVPIPTTVAGPDVAATIKHVLEDPEKYRHKAIVVFSERVTPNEIASRIGPEVQFQRLPEEIAGKAMPEEIHLMFKFFNEFPGWADASDAIGAFVQPPDELKKQFTPLDDFFKNNRDKIF